MYTKESAEWNNRHRIECKDCCASILEIERLVLHSFIAQEKESELVNKRVNSLLKQTVAMEHQDALEEVNFGNDVINALLRDDIFERVLYSESAFVG